MSYRETVAEQDFWVLVLCPAAGSQNNFENTTNGQTQKRNKKSKKIYLQNYMYAKWPQKTTSGFC